MDPTASPVETASMSGTSVTVIGHDLSSNATARALILEELLARRFPTELIGARFGRSVWTPAAASLSEHRVLRGSPYPWFAWTASRLALRATGRVLVAQKPRGASFGVALRAARFGGRPVILDIDDDESSFFGSPPLARSWRDAVSLRNPNGRSWTRRMLARIPLAAATTAGSPTLARRYGAEFIPYAIAGESMHPSRFDRAAERRRLGVGNGFAVVFCGSPRPHKGLDRLAEAIGALDAKLDAKLVLVASPVDKSVAEVLRSQSRERIVFAGPVAREERGRVLAAADCVALPQRDTPTARAQVPAKLFDAMAAARPIVATDVGDLAEILGDAGTLVPEGDVGALTRSLRRYATDTAASACDGARARERFERFYEAEEVSRRLARLVEDVVERARSASCSGDSAVSDSITSTIASHANRVR